MLAATIHQDLIATAPGYDADEFRLTNAGAWQVYQAQKNRPGTFISGDLEEKGMMSPGHTLKIPAFQNKSVTVRTSRPLIIPDDENTSAFSTVTWTTFAAGFTTLPVQHFNNYMEYVRNWGTSYKAVAVALLAAIEAAAVTDLDNGKTQVVNEVTGENIAFGSNVLSETGLSSLKESYILSQLRPIMASNDFYGIFLDVVGNQGLHGVLNMMEGFGGMNQENKTIQFLNNQFSFSNSIANAAGKNATGFAVADNTVGYLTRVERDAIMGTSLRTGHEWGTMFMPELGIDVGTYYYESAVDASAVHAGTADMTRTGKEAFDFAVDIAFVRKYNSDLSSIPSAIAKFDIDLA